MKNVLKGLGLGQVRAAAAGAHEDMLCLLRRRGGSRNGCGPILQEVAISVDIVIDVFLHILGVSLGVGLGHPFFCLKKLVDARQFDT